MVTFVFVYGGFLGAWVWTDVVAALEAQGLATATLDLPSLAGEQGGEVGDFYYGEMEMRRQAARGVERWLLTGYWAVSGYGLRASRAVLALVVLLAGATVGLYRQPPPAGLARRHPVHLYTSIPLLRPTATVPLTRWGQFIPWPRAESLRVIQNALCQHLSP